MYSMCPVEKIANMSPQEVNLSLKNGDTVLIDVRESWEFDQGHIQGALHLPMREITSRLNEIPRDKKVVLYCRTGNRSLNVAMFLCSQGFNNVINMTEGIVQWVYGIEGGGHGNGNGQAQRDEQILEIFRIAAGYARSQQFFYDKLLEKISGDNLKDNLKKTRDFAFLEYEKLNVFFRDKFSSLWTQYSTFMQDLEEMYRDERNLQLTEDLTQIIKKNSIDESLALRFVSDRESMGAEFYRKVANLFQDPTEALFFNTLYNDKKANLDDIQQNQWDKVKV